MRVNNDFYYVKPAQGYITSFFSNARKNPVLGVIRPHQGIDISSDADNTIIAAAAGVVRVTGRTATAGNYIIIAHPNGQETNYSHLAQIDVKAGQRVKQSQKIGVKGTTGNSTGVHLHFEISRGRWTSSYANKLDPLLHFYDPITQEVQAALNALGYGPLAADGVYGDATITAVTRYQKARGLTADGYAGRGTHAALKADAAGKVAAVSPSEPANSVDKEVDELEFKSGTLREELKTSLASKAHRQFIIDAALAQGYNGVHATRLKDGTIGDGDLLALAAGAIVKAALK